MRHLIEQSGNRANSPEWLNQTYGGRWGALNRASMEAHPGETCLDATGVYTLTNTTAHTPAAYVNAATILNQK